MYCFTSICNNKTNFRPHVCAFRNIYMYQTTPGLELTVTSSEEFNVYIYGTKWI